MLDKFLSLILYVLELICSSEVSFDIILKL